MLRLLSPLLSASGSASAVPCYQPCVCCCISLLSAVCLRLLYIIFVSVPAAVLLFYGYYRLYVRDCVFPSIFAPASPLYHLCKCEHGRRNDCADVPPLNLPSYQLCVCVCVCVCVYMFSHRLCQCADIKCENASMAGAMTVLMFLLGAFTLYNANRLDRLSRNQKEQNAGVNSTLSSLLCSLSHSALSLCSPTLCSLMLCICMFLTLCFLSLCALLPASLLLPRRLLSVYCSHAAAPAFALCFVLTRCCPRCGHTTGRH